MKNSSPLTSPRSSVLSITKSQLSIAVASMKKASEVHWSGPSSISWLSGQKVNTGGSLSTMAMDCTCVVTLPHRSVSVHVLIIPLRNPLSSNDSTSIMSTLISPTAEQLSSIIVGSPVTPKSVGSSVQERSKSPGNAAVGTISSMMVMVCSVESLLPQASSKTHLRIIIRASPRHPLPPLSVCTPSTVISSAQLSVAVNGSMSGTSSKQEYISSAIEGTTGISSSTTLMS